jgi:hypothetical protein
MPITASQVERLSEIREEMETLLDEARTIIRHSGDKLTQERFKGYVHSHIVMALTEQHEYLGKNMFTLAGLTEDLQSQVESEDDETADESEEAE